MDYSHKPVLKAEVLQAFDDLPLTLFIDGTVGGGGHSEALLLQHPEIQEFIGVDQDLSALDIAKKRLEPFENKLTMVHSNFFNALDALKHKKGLVDGILLDLGVSSMQLDEKDRGFSFRVDGPLDMRMDKSAQIKAEDILNTYTEEELGYIFRELGEEKQWKKAASAIVKARTISSLKTTFDLVKILEPVLFSRKYSIHPATLVFQGLRIAVNKELEVLKDVLPKALELLKTGGRLAIISFHSLEDRIVKQYFQKESLDKESTSGQSGIFIDKTPRLIIRTKKPIEASDEEIRENPRSRSAKLRVAEKK